MSKLVDTPEKTCERCGEVFGRARGKTGKNAGRLEERRVFLKRRYCSNACRLEAAVENMNRARQPKRPHYRDHLVGECEACGTTDELHGHHVDGNHSNDKPENIQTLCAICHGFWHRLIGRSQSRIKGRMPRLY